MLANQQPKQPVAKSWWNPFKHPDKKQVVPPYREDDASEHPVFGKALHESLQYASVQISTADSKGELYVWGYIPVVVAKCGLYLKEHATEVPGTFRVNGSNRRMRELQAAFETQPRYGKSLVWNQESYTTHDVASVFRRYLTQMPEPVIPYDMYQPFRDAITKEPLNQEQVISTYKTLIQRMPRPNQYLLLYVLDLLSVFARKSDKNLMTATNLAVIFRPGIISHPSHEMAPQEHALSQRVLEFLIAHQDYFMFDIVPPAGSDPASSSPGAGFGGPGGSGGASGRGGSPGKGKWKEGTSTPTKSYDHGGGAVQDSAGPSSTGTQRAYSHGLPMKLSTTVNVPHPKRSSSSPHTPTVRQIPSLPADSPSTRPGAQRSFTSRTIIPVEFEKSPPQPYFAPRYNSTPGDLHPNPHPHVHPTNAVPMPNEATLPPVLSSVPQSTTRPFSIKSGSTSVDDIMVIPGTDEEFRRLAGTPTPGTKSWLGSSGSGFLSRTSAGKDRDREKERLKEKERIKMVRRRTTLDRSEFDLTAPKMESPSSSESPLLTPTSPSIGADVKRSRTLPTRRKGTSIMTVEDEYLLVGKDAGRGLLIGKEREKRVLKKTRRASGLAKEKENGALVPSEEER